MKVIVNCIIKWIKKQYRNKVEKEFTRCYHDIVTEFNDHIDTWNAAYDFDYICHGDIQHYDEWIAKRMQDQINSKERSKFLVFHVNPEDDTVHAHIKGYEDKTVIYFDWKDWKEA